jgi:hypothetical protein
MSLQLDLGTTPAGVNCRIQPDPTGDRIVLAVPQVCEISIDPRDMCELVQYWLVNTDLQNQDARGKLLLFVAGLRTAPGFNASGTRLWAELSEAAVPPEAEYQPLTPKRPPGIQETLRQLPSGEHCYSGKYVDHIAALLRDGGKEMFAAYHALHTAVEPLMTEPIAFINFTTLRLTGPGDPGSRGIAFRFNR